MKKYPESYSYYDEMEKAYQDLSSLPCISSPLLNRLKYANEKYSENYTLCKSLCKGDSRRKICLYEPTSIKYAIATIKIHVPECSKMRDYTDVVYFTTYIENGITKKLPYEWIGLIPNYTYVIGSEKEFEENNAASRVTNGIHYYYLIEVQIPFAMERN